jgi:hypothetical protein
VDIAFCRCAKPKVSKFLFKNVNTETFFPPNHPVIIIRPQKKLKIYIWKDWSRFVSKEEIILRSVTGLDNKNEN